jgi:NADH-quinone oxidoreductase subunit A
MCVFSGLYAIMETASRRSTIATKIPVLPRRIFRYTRVAREQCLPILRPRKQTGSGLVTALAGRCAPREGGSEGMDKLLLEYLPILIFLSIAILLSGALILLPLVIAPSKPDPEKLSAYECGFPAFGDARMKFDVRFYLVSILFIIFDLEVAFLFPWAISLGTTGVFAFWSMMVFLGVLTVGFIYEWKKGALEWE